MSHYDHGKIEAKWVKAWEQKKAWKVNLDKAKKPYYNLMMFPYPSAEGLHVGNVYAFTGSDIHGRFQRMRGYDVFEPMGFDSFGIHSENFAIKQGTHPKEQTTKNIKHFEEQLKQLGALFDWERAVTTSDPSYYKWTQWLFVQLYKAGLAYKGKAPVDWCPWCKTVLADEQVIEGKCERCDSVVMQKDLEQWFFGITKYADRLLKNLDCLPAKALGPNVKVTKEMAEAGIDWTEKTKLAQRNWIGKSEGALLGFNVKCQMSNVKCSPIEVFTTRPDTLFGTTYMVLAPEHNLLEELKPKIKNPKQVQEYKKKAQKKSELERTELAKEKTGVELKGVKAINPATKEEIPIFIADYVLASYGTGAIMAVPAHDQRDFEFAQKYKLPIKQVICGNYPEPTCPVLEEAYTEPGHLVGSGKFDGMPSQKAKTAVTKFVGGKKTVKYHLRDWLISRQRYWGPPIPIIYCRKCWENPKSKIQNPKEGVDYVIIDGKQHAIVPVPEKDLPVKLPEVKNFRPRGTGKSPLASVSKFVRTRCPVCNEQAERETDVSDTFLDSSWYFLRYPSVGAKNSLLEIRNSKLEIPWNQQITRRWLPVDMYIGGHEHAVLHLLYARFITMALADMGHIEFEEPFKKFRAHGLITKGGAKMSKSKGNVVNPDDYFKKYGADTVRTYLMFLGPLSAGGDWSDQGIVGVSRFFNRLWNFVEEQKGKKSSANKELEPLRHRTIKKATEDLEALRYNTAIAALMEYFNAMSNVKCQMSNVKCQMSNVHLNTLLILLSPFAPHLTEELWERLGNKGSCHEQAWPTYNPKAFVEKEVRLVVQINGKVRDVLVAPHDISETEAVQRARELPKIAKWLEGKEPEKAVFVPGRLVNIVVAS